MLLQGGDGDAANRAYEVAEDEDFAAGMQKRIRIVSLIV